MKVHFYRDGAEWNAIDSEFGGPAWTFLGEPTEASMTVTMTSSPNGARDVITVFVPSNNTGDPGGETFDFDLASVGNYEFRVAGGRTLLLYWGIPDQGRLEGRSRYTATHAVIQPDLYDRSFLIQSRSGA